MANTTALTLAEAVRQPKTIADFTQIFGDRRKADKFIGGLMALATSNTNFSNCDPGSIIAAATQAACLNLELTPGLGYAAVIPYGKSAQFQPMCKGLIQLALRTGEVTGINVFEVYEDEYNGIDVITGDLRPLKTPIDGFREQNKDEKIVGFGAYIALTNGFKKTVYWSKDKCLAHGKKYSKTFNNGPWTTNQNEMCKKTVLKQLLNWVPKTTDIGNLLMQALQTDQMVYNAQGEASYEDNPNSNLMGDPNIVPDVDSEQRKQVLESLERDLGYSADYLATGWKVKTIDYVPTDKLIALYDRKMADKETQNNG